MEVYVKHLEGYINALKAEIKCRITNISVLKQANNHLDKDKKDVKVVANVSTYTCFCVQIWLDFIGVQSIWKQSKSIPEETGRTQIHVN